jgi:hypothetical protein
MSVIVAAEASKIVDAHAPITVTPTAAAVAAGAVAGLASVTLKAPAWAGILAFAGVAFGTKKLIDNA